MVAVGDKVVVTAPEGQENWGGWPKWHGKVCEVARFADHRTAIYVTHPVTKDEGYIIDGRWKVYDPMDDLRKVVDTLRQAGYDVDVAVTPPGKTIIL